MRSLRWALLLALGILLPWAASFARRPVEIVYSRRLFPRIAEALGQVSGRFPQSLAQVLIAAALALLVWAVIRTISRAIAPHRIIAAAAIAVWAFHVLWGLNYAREPVTQRLSIEPVAPETENLARLARRLAEEANRTYAWGVSGEQIFARSHGELASTRLRVDRADIGDRLGTAYDLLQPSFAGRTLSHPKFPALTSHIMTTVGISGFYFPYTGEATVNAMIPDASIPFTMAHEMAHQRGAAREDEANFWAYLACRETGLAAARYSGALEAFDIVLNALWRAAPDSARAIASTALDPGPKGDRAAIRAFWQRHEGRVSRVATQVNDSYLKVNAQPAGVETYGLAVELLLALEASGELDSQ